MIRILRTDSDNPDFRDLVRSLDKYLAIMDGDEHAFYAQYNKLDKIKHTVVAYKDNEPAGIGALRPYSDNSTEVKRMWVSPEHRNQGIAKAILSALEDWTKELGFSSCVLETGKRQKEAVQLYQKCGYTVIPNFGQYEGVENSVCMEKVLAE
jgi:GNAT superfamily N-acetyltransferase